MTKNTPLLAIAIGVATVAFALSPFLSRDVAGYRPEQFPVVLDFWPVQTAGWAFSIWALTGVITANVPAGNWLVIALCTIGIAALAIFVVLRPSKIPRQTS